MNYQECIAYLENVCPRGSSGGKERTAIMAELIGNPQDSLNIIHVAGTNGKGSTSAVIESILRHAGYRVGLFTSPHLERYEERIQINRQPIPEAEVTAIMSDLIETVIPKAMADESRLIPLKTNAPARQMNPAEILKNDGFFFTKKNISTGTTIHERFSRKA